MGSLKSLQAAAHDIGHHAQSGLSYIHPHLGQACRQAGVDQARVDLLTDAPYPAGLPDHQPLALALLNLRRRFLDILARYQLAPDDVTGVEMQFAFKHDRHDDSLCAVRTVITDRTGRTYERMLPYIDERAPERRG